MPTALRNRLLIRDHQIYAQQYRKSTFNSLLQNDLSNLIKKMIIKMSHCYEARNKTVKCAVKSTSDDLSDHAIMT